MQNIRSKVIKALSSHNYQIINNSFMVRKYYDRSAQIVPILLCNRQNLSHSFTEDINHINEFIAENCIGLNISKTMECLELAAYCLYLGPDYVLLDGYLLNNGKLILTSSDIHYEMKHKDRTDYTNVANFNFKATQKQLADMTYNTIPGKDNWNRIIKRLLDYFNQDVIEEKNTVSVIIAQDKEEDNDNTYKALENGNLDVIGTICGCIKSGFGYVFLRSLFSNSICHKSGLYQFSGVMSYANKMFNVGHPKNSFIPKSEVNQVIMLLILKYGLIKFLKHSSLLSNKKVTVHDYSKRITKGSNDKKEQHVIVNNNKFVQELIRVRDPRLVYLGPSPVKKDATKLKITSDGILNENTDNDGDMDDYSLTPDNLVPFFNLVRDHHATNKNGKSIWGYYLDDRNAKLGIILSNFKANESNINASELCNGKDEGYVYNEFKLNDSFYITIAQGIVTFGHMQELDDPQAIIPSILYYMYPCGFSIPNYQLDTYKIVGFGKGNIIKTLGKTSKPSKLIILAENGAKTNLLNSYTAIRMKDLNYNLYPNTNYGQDVKKAIRKHLKDIQKNKLFYNYVLSNYQN